MELQETSLGEADSVYTKRAQALLIKAAKKAILDVFETGFDSSNNTLRTT